MDRYGEEFDPLFCSAFPRPPEKRYCAQKDCKLTGRFEVFLFPAMNLVLRILFIVIVCHETQLLFFFMGALNVL